MTDGLRREIADERLETLKAFGESDAEPLLEFTLHQIRAFSALRLMGSPRRAGESIDKAQSVIKTQVDKVNEIFQELCNDTVAVAGKRNENYTLKPAGERFASWCDATLASLLEVVRAERQRAGRDLVIATTSFSIPLVSQVWEDACARLPTSARLRLKQIRTRDFWRALRTGDASLVLGAIATPTDRVEMDEDFAMEQWGSDVAAILLPENHPFARRTTIHTKDLGEMEVILPKSGIIIDYVTRVYGPEWKDRLMVEWWIEDVYYGINLLRTGIARGGMVMLKSVAEWAQAGGGTPDLMYPARITTKLKAIPLISDQPVHFVSGLFALKQALEEYRPDHPLRLFWTLFKERRQGPESNPIAT